MLIWDTRVVEKVDAFSGSFSLSAHLDSVSKGK